MNNLCRLSHVKRDLGGVSAMANTTDTVLGILQSVADVSGELVSETGRHFHAQLATRYVTVPRPCEANNWGRQLWLPFDLISITTLKVDDDADWSYGLTLVEGTDFVLWRGEDDAAYTPYVRIDIHPESTLLSTWQRNTRGREIQIVGLAGYSNETEAAGTLGAAITDAAATSATMTAGHSVEPGDTLWIDSEQLEVTAVSTNTLTVVRGINGTTAATHSNGAAVTRRRYPRDVEMAVKERVTGLRWDTQSGMSAQATLVGDLSGAAGTTTIRASYARWRNTVKRYKRWAVV
ncbi:MAG: hypothetical protein HY873_12070 [Chloroflexi bacterium]|nr:hypothetical protein [Chloroflexota bacterium]